MSIFCPKSFSSAFSNGFFSNRLIKKNGTHCYEPHYNILSQMAENHDLLLSALVSVDSVTVKVELETQSLTHKC